jgi:hypothetical protein
MASRRSTLKDWPKYKRDYERGWRSTAGLDRADADGRSDNEAWMDGYLDQAAGREKWHMLNCPDHNTCGKG